MSSNKCTGKIVRVGRRDPGLQLQPIDVKEFRLQCLDAHNRYRALHCCPPLTMCGEMNEFAMQWAMNLARIKRVESRHYPNYGENLYRGDYINVPGNLPVKRWYEEMAFYEFATSEYKPSVSHFTQVVWKNTRKIGIGVVRDGETTYVAVYYYPPGNIEGQFEKMVPRKKL